MQLITSQRSALRVWLEVLSGNSSDKESFAASVEAYCKQLGKSEKPYFVMDSAGYAADNLKTLKNMRWLMRVPETLAEAKPLVHETEKTAMWELVTGYWGKEVANTYGDIPQRWLVVFSQAAYERELHTQAHAQEKELHTAQKQCINCAPKLSIAEDDIPFRSIHQTFMQIPRSFIEFTFSIYGVIALLRKINQI